MIKKDLGAKFTDIPGIEEITVKEQEENRIVVIEVEFTGMRGDLITYTVDEFGPVLGALNSIYQRGCEMQSDAARRSK